MKKSSEACCETRTCHFCTAGTWAQPASVNKTKVSINGNAKNHKAKTGGMIVFCVCELSINNQASTNPKKVLPESPK